MHKLTFNALYGWLLPSLTCMFLVLCWNVESSEHHQSAIVAELNSQLLPAIHMTTQIRQALSEISLSVGTVRAQQASGAALIAQASIRENDQRIQQALQHYRHTHQTASLQRLAKLERAYQSLHRKLAQIALPAALAAKASDPLSVEHALASTLADNEALMTELQTHISQSTTALADTHALHFTLLLWIMLPGILMAWLGYVYHFKHTQRQGLALKKSIADLNRLVDTPARRQPPAHETITSNIERLLTTDALTGLPNALGLKQWLAQHQAQHAYLTCIFLHLDSLTSLSDYCEEADYKQDMHFLVNTLASMLPENSCLAIMDGDTFAVVSTVFAEGAEIGRYANALLTSMNHKHFARTKLGLMKPSLGIAHALPHLTMPDLLMKQARLALTKAKSEGGNMVVFFGPELMSQQKQKLEILSDLRKALHENEFRLVFQPQVDARSGCIVGAEALIRWQHSSKGMIPPGTFIPVAEEAGLIEEIGAWVLQQAIKVAGNINRNRAQRIPISINVSSHQFLSKDFVPRMESLLAQYKCEPAWIKLEITESVMLDNSSDLLKTMIEIAQKGIAISLDDFGTGYSSLNYLTQYPISQIKIDRTFIADIAIRLDSRELVRSIIRIAEIFQFEIVAEGVESEAQLAFFQDTSCQIIQGFYYYKPMPYEALSDILAQHECQ